MLQLVTQCLTRSHLFKKKKKKRYHLTALSISICFETVHVTMHHTKIMLDSSSLTGEGTLTGNNW